MGAPSQAPVASTLVAAGVRPARAKTSSTVSPAFLQTAAGLLESCVHTSALSTVLPLGVLLRFPSGNVHPQPPLARHQLVSGVVAL